MTVEVHNPNQIESKPLNTELETLAPETTAEQADLSPETHTTHQPSDDAGTVLGSVSAASSDSPDESSQAEPDYDAADFAAALANFDREQAAESAAAQNLTAEEVVVTGTVVKVTDKHVVVDIGLKSEGLIPLEQVVDLQGNSKFKVGDSVEVVVEREEAEGGYLVSHEKALRHKIWDTLEQAANDKVPVKGMVVEPRQGRPYRRYRHQGVPAWLADRSAPGAQSRRLHRHRD